MSLSHQKLRQKFSEFWQQRNHKLIPPIPLIPKDDPTTLFTGSGMQQLVPYLLGKSHPLGKKLHTTQPCFRSQDIEEVGDNRHTTFFEMMGNWSLGDYFKEEQLTWFWEFLTKELKFSPDKLSVTVFAGDKKNNLPADEESIRIWKKLGLPENRIFKYGPETILAAYQDNPDVFATDVYAPVISAMETVSNRTYQQESDKQKMRVIADHLKAAVLLIKAGVLPSNKERGYFLRRLLRRNSVKMLQLKGTTVNASDLDGAVTSIVATYGGIYFEKNEDKKIQPIVEEE